VTAVDAPAVNTRLLAGLVDQHGPGVRLDLAGHHLVHGPLPLRCPRSDREDIVARLAEAGLRGRGGAGFPTARKLETVRRLRRRPVVVVNAMEGEPASRKDHLLATQAPHLVLDGAEMLARALGAIGVKVCVGRGDTAAARSFAAAADERSRTGLASVVTEVVSPPARYVAGEESALVAWLDGGESVPAYRPDRPAVLRVGGRPALVDNAETVAQIALIARHGPAWFRSVGTPDAPGTALVTVSGSVGRSCVVEVPYGTQVTAVLAMGGVEAPPAGVLVGGYGGTWLGPGSVSTPYDPRSLEAVGAAPGVGVLVALAPGSCGLAETARIAAWMGGESAGQCGPCVFGLPAVAADLGLLAFGRAHHGDVDRMWARLDVISGRGACRHPDGVVRMVRSAIRAFGPDVDRHLGAGPCPGARWPSALSFPVRQHDLTRGAATWR